MAPQSIGALVSPHSTLEELHLASALVRGLGSDNIDYRLRNADFAPADGVRWLGTSIASLSQPAARAGGRLQPAQGPSAVRAAHPPGRCARARVLSVHASTIAGRRDAWAMPVANALIAPAGDWVAGAGRRRRGHRRREGRRRAVSRGDGRATRPRPSRIAARRRAQGHPAGQRRRAPCAMPRSLLALANWIGEQTGASVGYLTEAANTVGAQLRRRAAGRRRPERRRRCCRAG